LFSNPGVSSKKTEDDTMPSIHEEIQTAIRHLDNEKARRLVAQGLANKPDADLYYLASLLADDAEERLDYLEQAIDLNPHHIEANSELNKIMNASYFERRKPGTSRRKFLIAGLCLLILLILGAFFVKEKFLYEPLPAHLAGDWVGSSYADAVGVTNFEMSIRQEGSVVVGTISGINEEGRADVFLTGRYEDGYLVYETYGGSYTGWDGVCYSRATLEYKVIDGVAHFSGTFELLPSRPEDGWNCTYSGTIDLVQSE
jgi:hypothetical protein